LLSNGNDKKKMSQVAKNLIFFLAKPQVAKKLDFYGFIWEFG